MNRWALQRYTNAELWLRTRTDRMAGHLRSRADRGQTSFEYLGIAVVIAVIIGVLATTGIGNEVQKQILKAIRKVGAGKGNS